MSRSSILHKRSQQKLQVSLALAVQISMNFIAEIKKKLESYPELEWELEGSTISVSPKGGFTVWLTVSEDDCTVGYNGWHEEFEEKKRP